MRELAGLAVLLAAAGCVTGPVGPGEEQGAKILITTVTVDVGEVKHKEESILTDTRGDWSAVMARPRVVTEFRLPGGLELLGEASVFASDRDEETWKLNGVVVAEDDLELEGYELRALGGFGVDVEEIGRFSILGGVSYRDVEIDRRTGGADAGWDFELPIAEVEARARLPIHMGATKDVAASFDASFGAGYILEPEADVPGAGTIEGDDGWLIRFRAGFTIRPSDRLSFYLGGFYERLEIDGGTDGADEWPDSSTSFGGGEVGASWRF
jgi:hypothetical protein